ncbi:MAG: alpha/beta hydrolase [Myxococcales bacterium]|nr:alpha/beta hydrolase [Myxococcales bacterium]
MREPPAPRASAPRRPLLLLALLTACPPRPAPVVAHAPTIPTPVATTDTAIPAPVATTDTAIPAHHSFTLDSRILHETRRINLYLPPGLDPSARYPVLYMPDGGLAEDLPHLLRSVDAGIRAGELRPLIVVGIENTERRRDLTGPTDVPDERAIAPRVGGAAHIRRFLRAELIPAIDRRAPTSGEAAIIGESLAGLFILETFLLDPDLFTTAIAISPSLFWNHQALVRAAPAALRARPARPTTLYLTHASDDDDATTTLAAVLRQHAPASLRWTFAPRPDQHHATIYRAVAPEALRAVFPATAP